MLEDDMAPARGIGLAMIIGLLLWLVGVAAYLILRG
jgi:hypothetical protein